MTTQDDIKQEDLPEGVDAKVMEEYDHWKAVQMIKPCVLCAIFFLPLALIDVFFVGRRGVKSTELVLFVWGFALILANLKPAKPVRIILLLVGVLVSFLLSFMFLDNVCRWGIGIAIRMLGWICVGISTGILGTAILLYFSFKLNRRMFVSKGAAYREERMKCMQDRSARKIDAFLGRHPSLAVSGVKDFAFRFVRCAIWMVLPVWLVFAGVTIWDFLNKRPMKFVPHYSSFELDSFAGEKFGRVLSGDLERKKLSEPIGVIDELMLVTDGDPKRRLMYIYGQKYLENVSAEEANRSAEEVCAAFQRVCGFKLKWAFYNRKHKRFHKRLSLGNVYAEVKWKNHSFQQGKVLSLYVGLNEKGYNDSNLKVTEVMGYKIGDPISRDEKPRTQFWKFERVIGLRDGDNRPDSIYAVHDVSNLSLENAVKELEDARKAVERLHGIKMFKCGDYDNDKWYFYRGNHVWISVTMEYWGKKQIRYGVRAEGR